MNLSMLFNFLTQECKDGKVKNYNDVLLKAQAKK